MPITTLTRRESNQDTSRAKKAARSGPSSTPTAATSVAWGHHGALSGGDKHRDVGPVHAGLSGIELECPVRADAPHGSDTRCYGDEEAVGFPLDDKVRVKLQLLTRSFLFCAVTRIDPSSRTARFSESRGVEKSRSFRLVRRRLTGSVGGIMSWNCGSSSMRRAVGARSKPSKWRTSSGASLVRRPRRLASRRQSRSWPICSASCFGPRWRSWRSAPVSVQTCLKMRPQCDCRTLTIQTLFGTVTVEAPQMSSCWCSNTMGFVDPSFSSLADLLPDRCTPELRRTWCGLCLGVHDNLSWEGARA